MDVDHRQARGYIAGGLKPPGLNAAETGRLNYRCLVGQADGGIDCQSAIPHSASTLRWE